MNDQFFDEQTLLSECKTRIVVKYFKAWTKVMMPTVKRNATELAYLDLYAGQGRYDDGSVSTPLKILEIAISNPDLCEHLHIVFNESKKKLYEKLNLEIKEMSGIELLKNQPLTMNGTINRLDGKQFSDFKMMPTFSFIDPWGYKGLSIDLIEGVTKDWGCDCVFFFNYNRINAAITNDCVEEHMESLFGAIVLRDLRNKVLSASPYIREMLILEGITKALNQKGGKFVLPFGFYKDNGKISHYIIFVSKNFRGYSIMKDIMANESNETDQEVPSFTFAPKLQNSPLLLSLDQPLKKLEESLLDEFSGQVLTVEDIYMNHSVNRPYIRKNYSKVLLDMEKKGLIHILSEKRRIRNTCPDHYKITFPDNT